MSNATKSAKGFILLPKAYTALMTEEASVVSATPSPYTGWRMKTMAFTTIVGGTCGNREKMESRLL